MQLPGQGSGLQGQLGIHPSRNPLTAPGKRHLKISLLLNAVLLITALLYFLLREGRNTSNPNQTRETGIESLSLPAGSPQQERSQAKQETTRSPVAETPPGKARHQTGSEASRTRGHERSTDDASSQTHLAPGSSFAPEKVAQYQRATQAVPPPIDVTNDTGPPMSPLPDIPTKIDGPSDGERGWQLPANSSGQLSSGTEATDQPSRLDGTFSPPKTEEAEPKTPEPITTKINLQVLESLSDSDKVVVMSALANLQKFLAATSWEERVPVAHKGNIEKGRIRSYYATREPGPITPLSIQLDSINQIADSPFRFVIFHVRTTDIPEGFPVIVDEEEGGFKVAWRIFAEFHDDRLTKFISGWQDEPESFHLYMSRKHYLSQDAPDLDSLACFLIETPVANRSAHVFADQNSEVARDLAKNIPWGHRGHPVAQLEWTRASDGRPYIRIRSIERYGWGED